MEGVAVVVVAVPVPVACRPSTAVVVPLPEPRPADPEVRFGLVATGCEMDAERWGEPWSDVLCAVGPDAGARGREARAAEAVAAASERAGLTMAIAARPYEEMCAPAFACAVNVSVAGDRIPASLGQPL